MPSRPITGPQRFTSPSITRLKSAALPPTAVRPCASSRVFTAGSFSMSFTSALTRAITASGVPGDANRPFQASDSTLG